MASCAPQPKQEEEIPFEQPNFVIIFTDELAMADIGAYGGNIPASMCAPARFTFLSGLYPGRCVAPTFLK